MRNWTADSVEQVLEGNGFKFERKPIQSAVQFLLDEGEILCVYHTGKLLIQGRPTSRKQTLAALFGADAPESSNNGPVFTAANLPKSVKVFIVYGHDTQAREQLELLLRRLKLEPIVLQNVVSASQTVIEKLESKGDVNFACVLLTPDDEGHKLNHPEEKKARARQNVVLEMGMFLAKLGRKKVAILMKGDLEKPSDIEGLLYIPFKESVFEIKERLAAELQESGFKINIKDLLN